MIEAVSHATPNERTEPPGGPYQAPASPERGRTRTCVGCGERVLTDGPEGADLVRLVLGPGGEIAVDAKGGGFGRGAHVHARPACVERAAKAGLLRATKGAARFVREGDAADHDDGSAPEPLRADSLARAIQRSMDRRIEGLLAAAVRSRQVACGADAVTGACQRGDGRLVLVACDAAAAANLTEVRRAVAEGRAVAWGTKEKLGAIVAPGTVRGRLRSPPGSHDGGSALEPPHDGGSPAEGARPDAVGVSVGVVAVASRTLAEAIRRAVQAASAVASVAAAVPPAKSQGARSARGRRSDG